MHNIKKTLKRFICVLLIFQSAVHSYSQIIPTPTITVHYPSGDWACDDTGVQLVSSATTGNIWSNGATTRTITAYKSDTYFVSQVVGSNTSAPSAPVTTTVYPIIHPTITPLGPFCNNSPPVVIQFTPAGTGYISGAGVISDSNGVRFDPSIANVNYPNIIYLYLHEYDMPAVLLCNDTARISVIVNICDGLADPESTNKNVKVFPTPFTDKISVNSIEIIKGIFIRDINGSRIQAVEGLGADSVELSLGDSPSGIYVVEIVTETGTVRRRVVKIE